MNTTDTPSAGRSERLAVRKSRMLLSALFILLLLTLGYQLSSLYYLPQYDGARFWGDEFGQILELKTELERGYAAIPTGKGATVEATNGIVRGNSWLAAIVYGLPALLFYPHFDLVTIGRTVSALLSLILLVILYAALRRFGSSKFVALAATLVLIANQAFVFASHSARLDIAAGLSVLAWVGYCTWQYRQLRQALWQPGSLWFTAFGACTFALVTFSIHLLTLLGPAAVFVVYVFGKEQRAKAFAASASGVLAVAGILFAIYASTGAPLTLFGETPHRLQSHDVLSAMPVFRPFSWSVQSSNLVQRFEQFRIEAPFVAALFMASLVVSVVKWRSLAPATKFALACSGIVVLCWLQFQSSAVYYLTHITPLLVFISVMILRTLKPRRWKTTLALGCVALAALHFAEIEQLTDPSRRRDTQNRHALQAIEPRLPDDGSTILVQYPAVSILHRTLGDRLMTTHFVNFPVDSSSVEEVLRKNNVSTIVLYRTAQAHNYSFEVAPLWAFAQAHGKTDTLIRGDFFDVEVGEGGTDDELHVVSLKR